MTETDEIAAQLLSTGYLHWIAGTMHLRGNCMAAAREYTRQQMLDAHPSIIDNVAYALFRAAAIELNQA